MERLQHDRDFANLLLIVLKVLLVIFIGLQSLLYQLGLSSDGITGVVNATPSTQTSYDGTFQVSFHTLFYAPGAGYTVIDLDSYVTVWRCLEQGAADGSFCPITGEGLQQLEGLGKDDPLPDWLQTQWIQLDVTRKLSRPQPRAPGSGPRAEERSGSLHNETFNLNTIPGTYRVIYRVISEAPPKSPQPDRYYAHWKTSAPATESGEQLEGNTWERPTGFEIFYDSKDPGEWQLPLLEIIQGRSARMSAQLDGFRLETGGAHVNDGKPRIGFSKRGGANWAFVSDFRGITLGRAIQHDLLITSKITEIGANFFKVEDDPNPILIGTADATDNRRLYAEFLRFDDESGTFIEEEFRDMNVGDAVYYELRQGSSQRVARLVRFGQKAVPATLPIVVRQNLPPRGIYNPAPRVMAFYFPDDAYNHPLTEGGPVVHYFNLNFHIIDPDGADLSGSPSIHLPRSGFEKVGTWPEHFSLEEYENNTLLTFTPDRLYEGADQEQRLVELQLKASDEWNRSSLATTMTLRIRYRTLDTLYDAIRQIQDLELKVLSGTGSGGL